MTAEAAVATETIPPSVVAARMPDVDKQRMRSAAIAAHYGLPTAGLLPVAIGEHIARDLTWWADNGWVLGGDGIAWDLVRAIEDLQRQHRVNQAARGAFRRTS